MVSKRHTTPLPALPSELLSEFSDSDDGLDDAARAAKRRKIEKLGQDYLEGRPLFILSAGLKGPLDKGWVNPWKRNKGKDKKPQRGASLWKQDREKDFRNGISSSRVVSSEANSKPLKRRMKPSPQVHRQGSGFESSLDLESVQGLRSDQLRRESGSRGRGQLETDIFSARQSPSTGTFSKPRTVSARVNSTTAERAPRSVSASTSYRFSVDSNNSWLKTDEKRLHPQAYERPTGSSPTPGYRRRSLGKIQQDGGLQHDNKRQRVDDLIGDNNKNYTPPRISFTPINGQGALASLHKTVREPRPEDPQPSRKSPKSPGGHSRFSKPGKPASAFTGIPSRNEKEVVHEKRSCKSSTITQPSGSLQAVPSTDHFPESEYPHPDRPASRADTISNSNGNIEHSKRYRSQVSPDRAQPESKDGNPNSHNSSHTLPLDPTPNGTHGLQDNLQTASNTIALEALPFAQIVPDHFKFPIPTMSLHSMYFSAGYPSNARRSQNGGYEEQLSTQAPIAVAQKSLQGELATQATKTSQTNNASKAGVTGEHASISGRQTNKHGQDAITAFDFSTVKRIKPGRRSEAEAEAIVPLGKRKDEQKEGRIRARNPDILNDSSLSPSRARNQAQSLSLSPKSTSNRHHREHSSANGSTSINAHKRTVLPPPSFPDRPSNASSTNVPVAPPGETQSHDADSTILPFNLTASTNDTRQYQEGQGHAPGWDNFDLSQAIADAGTFLGSWDFEKVELERITHSNSVKSLNSISNMGNKNSRNTNENSNGAGARSG
ncbi:hypothetical protein EMPG_16832 [Blastomyces silverae]|uniref:Uncharacterized protein n=1 Tax=Blastomyces silverae TaxID=2060906 RepID=A0A0H1B9K2_9EURO|nr:hypothetical protein EMPG_16832 [Blastomyces silverae]